jgi:putative phosphoribosyl transferase
MRLFADRDEAGEKLAREFVKRGFSLKQPMVLGIPRGGIPVGYALAKDLEADLDVVVVRKLPIPESPEAGFGAVTLDRTVFLNDELVGQIFISETEITKIVDYVYAEVLRRNRIYRGDKSFPDLKDRSVIITDDGLASGYTMLSAIEFCRKKAPEKIIAASPVAHKNSYDLIEKSADSIVVLHISDFPYFAVASFYEEFPDMSDEEVIAYLKKEKHK